MRKSIPPNTQTIASLHGHGLCFVALCSACNPPRVIYVDMAKLIEVVGPDKLVTEASKLIKCKGCGSHVHVQVGVPKKEGRPF